MKFKVGDKVLYNSNHYVYEVIDSNGPKYTSKRYSNPDYFHRLAVEVDEQLERLGAERKLVPAREVPTGDSKISPNTSMKFNIGDILTPLPHFAAAGRKYIVKRIIPPNRLTIADSSTGQEWDVNTSDYMFHVPSSDTSMKFKVGDIVRATSKYSTTILCRVTDILDDNTFVIEVIHPFRQEREQHTEDSRCYRLATEADYKEFNWRPVGVGVAEVSKGEKSMKLVSSLTDYVEKHKDLLFSVVLVLVLDHYVFEGKFRQKIEKLVDSFLEKKTAEIV